MKSRLSSETKAKSKLTKEEWREYTKTVWHIANVSDAEHPAVFPAEIPKRLIKLFSFCDETVLDPFAGVGTTAQAAIALGRRAVCIDQNPRYTKLIRARCRSSRGNGTSEQLRVITGDSRHMRAIDDGSIGLVVTSPPYWNKADYGRSRANIGNEAHYGDFLTGLQPVFRECLRVLQPGRKLCVVTANVNQYTDHGLLTFALAADLIVLLRKVGFVLVNEVIWSKDGTGGRWGSWGSQRPIFGSYPYPPNFLFKNVHEHIIIVGKPIEKPIRNAKALKYLDLMPPELVADRTNGSPPNGRKVGRRPTRFQELRLP